MIKLSVNETKWSILLARTRALILIFRFEYLILGPLSYREFRETGPWRQLFERWMPLCTGWFSIHWIAQLVSPILIRWAAIYPVDSTIHILNNRGLVNKGLLIRPKRGNFLADQRGSPERARWSHLGCWGGQSEHIFRFILPAHEFSHIIRTVKIEVTSQVV